MPVKNLGIEYHFCVVNLRASEYNLNLAPYVEDKERPKKEATLGRWCC